MASRDFLSNIILLFYPPFNSLDWTSAETFIKLSEAIIRLFLPQSVQALAIASLHFFPDRGKSKLYPRQARGRGRTGPRGGTVLRNLIVLLPRLVLWRSGGPPFGLKEIDKDDENRDGDDD